MTEEIKVIPTNGTSADNVKYAKKVEAIYIDGVDVAGCDSLNKNSLPLKQCDLLQFKTKNGGIAGRWCTDHYNCYYKQLKRLEQENKELKKQIESNKGLITVGGKQQYEMTMAYDRCKSALEEIKKIIKSYDLTVDNGVSVDTLYTIRKKINEVLK